MNETNLLKAAQEAISALNQSEWADLQIWMISEKDRRLNAPVIDKAQEDLIRQEREDGTRPSPKKPDDPKKADDFDAWKPSGVKYIKGDRVHIDGRVWESVHPGINPYSPGEWAAGEAWRDVTEDVLAGKAAEPDVQKTWNPTAHYTKGDVVEWEGKRYQVTDVVQPGGLPPDGNPKKYKRI